MTTMTINDYRYRGRHYRGRHHGEEVIILGNGPSLRQLPIPVRFDTIGINYSWQVIASYYHCVGDAHHVKDLNAGKWAPTVLFNWSSFQAHPDYCTEVRMDLKPRWWGSPRGPKFHSLSGSRAVQLARWLGFTTAYLVGFDGSGTDFRGNSRRPNHYRNQIHELSQIVAGTREVMEIYNCSSKDSPHDLPRFDIDELREKENSSADPSKV